MTSADSSVRLPISIVIFDATGITSDLLKRAFSMQSEYEVVGCSKNVEETIRVVAENQPDTIIISAFEQHSSFTAIELLDELSRIGSSAHAIILSSHPTNDETVAYFRAQARGILSGPSADFDVLCKCVNCVHSGQIWATSEQLVCLIKSLSRSRKKMTIVNAKGLPILSAREEEVLHLLAKGLSNRDMAAVLMLSEHTVRNHLFHIFDKLGVSSRMEAVLYAFNHLEDPMQPVKSPLSKEKMAFGLETEHSRTRQPALETV
jgi:DNA-binding NarL/FixJ family response regulator